jgi:hypothetical protein
MSIKFLTFGNVVRTAMMPVFGATGAISGEYIGEIIDMALYSNLHNHNIIRICMILGCGISALIGATLRLYWEKYEHEKKHNDALHLVD